MSMMDSLLGLLRIRVKRGVNLAVRDVRSSDPYVVVKMAKQVLLLFCAPLCFYLSCMQRLRYDDRNLVSPTYRFRENENMGVLLDLFGDLGFPNDPIEGKLAEDVSLIDCFWWIVCLLAALFNGYGVRR